MSSERGQVSVEYAISAAMFAVAIAAIIGLFQHQFLIGWMEAVKKTVLVSVESQRDAKIIGREAANR